MYTLPAFVGITVLSCCKPLLSTCVDIFASITPSYGLNSMIALSAFESNLGCASLSASNTVEDGFNSVSIIGFAGSIAFICGRDFRVCVHCKHVIRLG